MSKIGLIRKTQIEIILTDISTIGSIAGFYVYAPCLSKLVESRSSICNWKNHWCKWQYLIFDEGCVETLASSPPTNNTGLT